MKNFQNFHIPKLSLTFLLLKLKASLGYLVFQQFDWCISGRLLSTAKLFHSRNKIKIPTYKVLVLKMLLHIIIDFVLQGERKRSRA